MVKSGNTSENVRYRSLVLGVVLLAAFVFGIAAGLLSWLGGTPVTLAVLAGFAAFGGSAIFILAVLRFAYTG